MDPRRPLPPASSTRGYSERSVPELSDPDGAASAHGAHLRRDRRDRRGVRRPGRCCISSPTGRRRSSRAALGIPPTTVSRHVGRLPAPTAWPSGGRIRRTAARTSSARPRRAGQDRRDDRASDRGSSSGRWRRCPSSPLPEIAAFASSARGRGQARGRRSLAPHSVYLVPSGSRVIESASPLLRPVFLRALPGIAGRAVHRSAGRSPRSASARIPAPTVEANGRLWVTNSPATRSVSSTRSGTACLGKPIEVDSQPCGISWPAQAASGRTPRHESTHQDRSPHPQGQAHSHRPRLL